MSHGNLESVPINLKDDMDRLYGPHIRNCLALHGLCRAINYCPRTRWPLGLKFSTAAWARNNPMFSAPCHGLSLYYLLSFRSRLISFFAFEVDWVDHSRFLLILLISTRLFSSYAALLSPSPSSLPLSRLLTRIIIIIIPRLPRAAPCLCAMEERERGRWISWYNNLHILERMRENKRE